MRRLMMGLALMCLTLTLLAQDVLKEDSLQEVVVTGTGTQHLLKDAPVQTEVITGQMLKNFSGSSIADILSGLTASFAFNEGDMGSQMQMNGLCHRGCHQHHHQTSRHRWGSFGEHHTRWLIR